jgi:hypothetical protein
MLREAFGEHSLCRTAAFEWHSRFKAGQVSVEYDRVTKHQQNHRKCWKNSRTHPWRPSPNNPWARRHCWDQLWSFPGDLNRKFEHAQHCCFITTTHPLTHPWKPQSLWLTNNMVIIPHPPY